MSESMQDTVNCDQPTIPFRTAVTFSAGIRAIAHIAEFLGVDEVVSPRQAKSANSTINCVLVWGRKQNSAKALNYARLNTLAVWYLEDGWIRSCDEDAHSRKTYSLLVDKSGVYYDSANPSDLETQLNLSDDAFAAICDDAQLQEAARCRDLIVNNFITKYNYCKRADPEKLAIQPSEAHASRPLVLVIDQTLNDVSVRCSGLVGQDFEAMLDAAIRENPEARIVVRTHPDVVEGKREGYLVNYARKLGVELHAEADNPIEWLVQASRVYVGSSQIGYEALLCGCKVTVFGRPFYAGWGLTDDRTPVPNRVRTRSINQLFFASHMSLAHYCCPITGSMWTLGECIAHVIEQKRQFNRNAYDFQCIGITAWKRRYIAKYLRSPDGSVRFGRDISKSPKNQLITWSYRESGRENQSVFRMEDGFIRSQGLGSDYVAPGSLVVDSRAMYFDRHQGSDLEILLNSHECTPAERERAQRLIALIVASRVSKYNMPVNSEAHGSKHVRLAGSKRGVLVIGQVEDDESIRRGCASVNTNSLLCKAARALRPDDHLVYKPHPDVVSGNRRGALEPDIMNGYVDEVIDNVAISDCIDNCDELHTMTSLTGFEALLRNKQVVTHGLPFYAGWGLTDDQLVCDRRSKTRSLNELVFLALIAYPRYLHIPTGEFIQPEMLVRLVEKANDSVVGIRPGLRWATKIRNISSALLYAA